VPTSTGTGAATCTSIGTGTRPLRILFQNEIYLRGASRRWTVVPTLTPPHSRTLNELRTIQYLEETVGPAGLRRLADALHDDEARAVVQQLRRRAASASLELEALIEEWSQLTSNEPRRPKPLQPGGLDLAELIESFVEVKRSSAELLRRAAREAPSDTLRERLEALAVDEDHAAQTLGDLAAAGPTG
jgi:rubrerythrin